MLSSALWCIIVCKTIFDPSSTWIDFVELYKSAVAHDKVQKCYIMSLYLYSFVIRYGGMSTFTSSIREFVLLSVLSALSHNRAL